MKKKLVASLAAAMVLGIAGTSFAASNPFVDVPAKHWSYDSVTKLAQAGVIDGYGDGTFRGDKTVTRYEMAQMVAKAMGNEGKATAVQKAEIKKLVAEYSDELDKLGVRVSALENRVGTVKFSGDARVRWVAKHPANSDTTFSERLRLNLNANVNENTSFYGRLVAMQHNEFGTSGGAAPNNDNIKIANAEFTTKNIFNSGATATIGRFSQKALATGYFLDTTGMVDGVKVGFGNKVKMTVGYANFSPAFYAGTAPANADDDNIFFTTASYATSKVTTVYGAWFNNDSKDTINPMDFKGIAVTTKVAPNVGFTAEYAKNTNSIAKDINGGVAPYGWVTKFNYKGANVKQQGTFGLGLEYRKFTNFAYVHNDYTTATQIPLNGLKGIGLSADYVLASNILLQGYQTFQTKDTLTGDAVANYSRVQINYLF